MKEKLIIFKIVFLADKVYQLYTYKQTHFTYLPKHYDTTIFTEWYAEVPTAIPLIYSHDIGNQTFYFFNATNNFTGIVNPNNYRIGCAVATYYHAYAVICTYLIDKNRQFFYKMGKPGSLCEVQFPRHSSAFERLCAADDVAFLRSSKTLWISTILFNVFLFFWLNKIQ